MSRRSHRAWATAGTEAMEEDLDLAGLARLLARSYRPGWADAGLLFDHFRTHGLGVLLLTDAVRTGADWLCVWRTTAGTILRKDIYPWRAVRLVAEAACARAWSPDAEALAGLHLAPPTPFQLTP